MEATREAFTEGVAAAIVATAREEGQDHTDFHLPTLFAIVPEGADYVQRVVNAIREADEGGTLKLCVIEDSFGDEYLRVIDTQAGEGFLMEDERVKELMEGDTEVPFRAVKE